MAVCFIRILLDWEAAVHSGNLTFSRGCYIFLVYHQLTRADTVLPGRKTPMLPQSP